MSKTIFLLGAGASRAAGAPLMNDFLDVAHDLWQLKKVDAVSSDFERVFAAIASLQGVHSKARLDINNIETVFSALEVANTLGKFPGIEPSAISHVIASLKTLIVTTLQTTIQFTVVRERGIEAPRPYDQFALLLRHLIRDATPNHSIAILTFNYDVCADVALYCEGLDADYGLNPSPPKNSIPLLKLHGSLNWAERSTEPKIRPWAFRDYWRQVTSGFPHNYNSVTIPIGSQLEALKKDDKEVTGQPVIVAPTANKGESHRALSAIWSRAAAELSTAENIFVIGYSMPPTDSFFHYLYALGTFGEIPLKRFWVFNPDDSGDVEARFRALLGPGAEARFRYVAQPFAEAIKEVRGTFPQKK